MVFSSIPFLFFFFPICFILYCAVPFSWKNGILLLFSLIFYTWGEPRYIMLLLFATGVDYINGRLMERYGADKKIRTIFLCSSVIINLSVLAFFKYADFIIKRAEQMQPVIMIDGGRKLTIVFTDSIKASAVHLKKVRKELYTRKQY